MFAKKHGWMVMVPSPSSSTAPSSKTTFSNINNESDLNFFLNFKSKLHEHFNEIIATTCFNKQRWLKSMFNLTFQLDCMADRVSNVKLEPSEVEVQCKIIQPLLHMIIDEANTMLKCEMDEFQTIFTMQHPVDMRTHVQGRKSSVDYLIRGEVEETLSLLPVEAKKVMDTTHVAQIADYVSRLAPHIKGVVPGVLIDQTTFRFVFSLFSDDENDVMPVAMISPSIIYRKVIENSYILLDVSICALILLLRFKMDRVILQTEDVKQHIPNVQKYMEYMNSMVIEHAPFEDVLGGVKLLEQINRQNSQISKLKEQLSLMQLRLSEAPPTHM